MNDVMDKFKKKKAAMKPAGESKRGRGRPRLYEPGSGQYKVTFSAYAPKVLKEEYEKIASEHGLTLASVTEYALNYALRATRAHFAKEAQKAALAADKGSK